MHLTLSPLLLLATNLLTLSLAAPTPAPSFQTYTLTLSPNGFNADIAKRSSSPQPGQCDTVCPNGSPRIASCSQPFYGNGDFAGDARCWCAGNGMQCVPGKFDFYDDLAF